MSLRRLAYGFSSMLISLSSLFVLVSPVAHAAGNVCTWVSGSDFSTATWSGTGCGSGPTVGDAIVLDVSGLGANTTLNNDIVGLSLTAITSTGTNASGYGFTLTGNDLLINGDISGGQNMLTLDLNITIGTPTTINGGVALDTTKTITLGSNLTIIGQLYADGIIAGTGDIGVSSNAYLNLFGANTFTGNITIQPSGMLNVDPGGLGNVANSVTVVSEGVLTLCGFNGATLANPLTLAGDGTGTDGAIMAYGSCGLGGGGITGPVAAANATLSGDITLTANTIFYTSGLLKFTGATATGNFTSTINAGLPGTIELAYGTNGTATSNGVYKSAVRTDTITTNAPSTPYSVEYNNILVINATVGDVDVYSGVLKGTGTVGVLTVSGGSVAPGLSPGILNSGNVTFTGGSFDAEIGGTTAGSGYDQLNVTGTVDLGTTTTLNVSHWSGFRPALNDAFTIINNDGADAVTGTFQGLAQGATVTVDGVVYTISYTGGDGNDVVLTATDVSAATTPEAPNTGFEHFSNNPLATLLATLAIVAIVSAIARRQLKNDK